MVPRLPLEILAIVAQNAPTETQVCLCAVSRDVYFISVNILYASIPSLKISRTTQCLRTLSANPEVARLVRSFSLRLSESRVLRGFKNLLSRALRNMGNLHTLLLRFGISAMANVMNQVSCRLSRLLYAPAFEDTYVITRFLSTQPAIEELTLYCHQDSISGHNPEILPGLRSVAAPSSVLLKLLPTGLRHIDCVTVLGTITAGMGLLDLCLVLGGEPSASPGLTHLAFGVDITEIPVVPAVIAHILVLIGLIAPSISSLELHIDRGHIRQEELQDMFTLALPKFPNLKTLMIISPPLTAGAPIQNPPPAQSIHISPDTLSSVHGILTSMANTLTSISDALSVSSIGPNPIPDALYDTSCHKKILRTWRRIHPGLQSVEFSVGRYIFRSVGE